MQIVIGGPKNSGKSTLTASLYSLLKVEGGISVGLHEIDVYSDSLPCILGIKTWEERRKRKHAWFNPTIQRRIAEFSADQSSIVLDDLPGKLTNQFLPRMIEPADCAIVIGATYEGAYQWIDFFRKHGKPVLARAISVNPAEPISKRDGFMPVEVFGRRVTHSHGVAELARLVVSAVHGALPRPVQLTS